jgi:hypothetical protein
VLLINKILRGTFSIQSPIQAKYNFPASLQARCMENAAGKSQIWSCQMAVLGFEMPFSHKPTAPNQPRQHKLYENPSAR